MPCFLSRNVYKLTISMQTFTHNDKKICRGVNCFPFKYLQYTTGKKFQIFVLLTVLQFDMESTSINIEEKT